MTSPNLDMLKDLYPGRVFISPIQVAVVMGHDSAQTIYNKINLGTFPCEVLRHPPTKGKTKGNIKGVTLVELAKWLDGGADFIPPEDDVAPPVKRGRGRPRKERIQIATEFWSEVIVQINRIHNLQEIRLMDQSTSEVISDLPHRIRKPLGK